MSAIVNINEERWTRCATLYYHHTSTLLAGLQYRKVNKAQRVHRFPISKSK